MSGPIDARVADIVARVADSLHGDPDDEWIQSAVDAAVGYVETATSRETIGLPDNELTVNGLVGFSTRLYLDGFSPNGAQVAIADPTFEPIFQPENLWKHWRHYFKFLFGYSPDDDGPNGWGIA